ncbi:family A1 protease [Mycena pura]|uniref:Family A1 protease n=1 Tax=Mycena pura TaxID=153505 RepID=A0AAD6V727_9AGAR|nr:family A1 protease [Mycena pura]
MLLALTLLPAIFLAFPVNAGPVILRGNPISLPLSRHLNFTGTKNIVQSDLIRIRNLRTPSHDAARDTEDPISNGLVSYVASVGVGEPAKQYNLIVDTGSSNTWVGAGEQYVKTATSRSTIYTVVSSEWRDTVTLAPDLIIEDQSIGVASKSTGFDGVDLTLGTLALDFLGIPVPLSKTAIPTVTDNLFSQKTITENVISVSFEPPTSTAESETNGEITFGGTDKSKYTGEITYTPITSTSPASKYWGIDQSISCIVDTGTTLIYLATNAFNAYQNATGGAPDSTTGLLSITPKQFADLKDLNFVIAGKTFALTPNAQIWPRSLNTAIGGTAGKIYLIVADIGSVSGLGLDFINGMTFLERFYSVYDTANKRVGIATTPRTTATTN